MSDSKKNVVPTSENSVPSTNKLGDDFLGHVEQEAKKNLESLQRFS